MVRVTYCFNIMSILFVGSSKICVDGYTPGGDAFDDFTNNSPSQTGIPEFYLWNLNFRYSLLYNLSS